MPERMARMKDRVSLEARRKQLARWVAELDENRSEMKRDLETLREETRRLAADAADGKKKSPEMIILQVQSQHRRDSIFAIDQVKNNVLKELVAIETAISGPLDWLARIKREMKENRCAFARIRRAMEMAVENEAYRLLHELAENEVETAVKRLQREILSPEEKEIPDPDAGGA